MQTSCPLLKLKLHIRNPKAELGCLCTSSFAHLPRVATLNSSPFSVFPRELPPLTGILGLSGRVWSVWTARAQFRPNNPGHALIFALREKGNLSTLTLSLRGCPWPQNSLVTQEFIKCSGLWVITKTLPLVLGHGYSSESPRSETVCSQP